MVAESLRVAAALARRAACLVTLALLATACGSSNESPPRVDAGASPDAPDGRSPDARVDAGAARDGSSDGPEGGEPTEEQRRLLATLRYDDGAPPADPSNRFADDPAARRFGRKLFFDPSLSGPLIEGDNDGSAATLGKKGEAGRVSCASCHVPESAFVDTRSPHRQISLAAEWTTRRAPTLLEVGFAPLYNWDGGRDSLWSQAIGVMESSREFNSGRLFVALQIFRNHRVEYEALFGALPPLDDAARFPPLTGEDAGCTTIATREGPVYECRGKPGDGAEYDALALDDQRAVTRVAVNVGKALGAYLRQLRCGEGPFDAWLDGDESAIGASARRGAALFVGRGQCVSCHSGPNLTDGSFHNVGLAPAVVAVTFIDADDRGAADGIAAAIADPLNSRGEFSDGDRGHLPDAVDDTHLGAFRTPTLRCAASHPSFMHTGQLRTLSGVVAFHVRGGDPAGYPGTNELRRLDLSESERADIVAFLETLTGEGPPAELLSAPAD